MIETTARIVEIRQETHDVKTFVLDLDEEIDFAPGQHCMVSLVGHEGFESDWRPFTFACAPSGRRVELTVKETGPFTRAMHRLRPGERLRVRGPFGKALIFDESVKDDVVFVAGGSGITPFISAIRFAVSRNLPNRITLLFSNKSAGDIIYRDELERLNKSGNISVVNTLTSDIPEDWHGACGRFTGEMIAEHVDRPEEKLWYVCGPPQMVEHVKGILREIGVPEGRLRLEQWQGPKRRTAGA